MVKLSGDGLRAIRAAQGAEIPDGEIGRSLLMLGLGLILAADGWEGAQAELEMRLKDAKLGKGVPEVLH